MFHSLMNIYAGSVSNVRSPSIGLQPCSDGLSVALPTGPFHWYKKVNDSEALELFEGFCTVHLKKRKPSPRLQIAHVSVPKSGSVGAMPSACFQAPDRGPPDTFHPF
jgi:hypothetical protein